MARIALESAHLMRLAQLLSQLRETASGEVADRAARAEQWLKGQVASEGCHPQTLRDCVNSIRREWTEFPVFSQEEEFHFRSQEEFLSKIRAEDWTAMKDYLAYVPRQSERMFQVESREWFLRKPQDTLTKARRWVITHRQPAMPKRETEKFEPGEMDPETKQIFQELFSNLLPPKPPQKPPPKCDASGQTSFID